MDTSTSWFSHADRSTLHSCHPGDRPEVAFQPAPEQSAPWYRSSQGCSSNQPSGHDSPVLLLVMAPFVSASTAGRVTQSSWPGVCASTNTKSQSGSVSCDMKNDRSVPSSTVNVFMSRWYRTSARCEYTYCTPLCGSYGPASPVTHSPGAVLVNCG